MGVLTAVDLTHVRHHHDDALGAVMAWFSLLPVFIAFGGFPTHALFRRDLRSISFCIGLLIDDVVNHVIKYSIKHPRPAIACEMLELCDSYGMPSAHSQFMSFFATFITLLALRKLSFNDYSWRYIMILTVWTCALTTMWSRVYLGYHTFLQICAGGSLGVIFGSAWFFFVDNVLAPHFPAISDSPWGKYFCIKDDSHISNVAAFEYENSRAARLAAAKAKAN